MRRHRARLIAAVAGVAVVLLAAPVRGGEAEEAASAARREAVLRGYLRDHPGDPAAHLALSDHLRSRGLDPAEGTALLRAALALDPSPALAERIRASLGFWHDHVERRSIAPDIRRYAAETSDPELLAGYGNALQEIGALREGKTLLLRAARSGSQRAAWQVFQHATRRWMEGWEEDEAGEFLRSALARWPGEPAPLLEYGKWLERQGREPEAAAHYRLAVDAAVAQSRAPDVEALYLLASLLERQGDVEGSLAATRATLALPGIGSNEVRLGARLSRFGRHDEALAVLRQVVAAQPGEWALTELGRALLRADRVEEACRAFRSAIALRPASTEGRLLLGTCLERQARHDEAIAAYRVARSLAPADPLPAAHLGRLLIGASDREAERHLRDAVALDPEWPFAHYYLGIVLQRQGKLPAAISSWRRYAALAPDDPQGHLQLAAALGRQGRLDEAAAALLRAGGSYSVWVARAASRALGPRRVSTAGR